MEIDGEAHDLSHTTLDVKGVLQFDDCDFKPIQNKAVEHIGVVSKKWNQDDQ